MACIQCIRAIARRNDKILTKAEYYDYAMELLKDVNVKVGKHNLIQPEIDFYNKYLKREIKASIFIVCTM